MARGHGKVSTGFWNDPRVRSLPEDARSLLLYLFTSPHSTAAGCYVLPIAYAARDLQWDIERVSKGFGILSQKPFVLRDETTDVIHIPGWWDENKPENPNVAVHVVSLFEAIPDCALKRNAINAVRCFVGFKQTVSEVFLKAYPNPFETLSEPVRIPEPEPEPLPDIQPTAGAVAPLKDRLFGPCAEWLSTRMGKKLPAAKAVIGKLIRDHGDGATLEAMTIAERNCPAGDPVAYLETLLKTKARHAKPTAANSADAHLAGLANALGLGEMGTGHGSTSNESPIIDGHFQPVEPDGAGEPLRIRAGDGEADRVRGGVRDSMPGPQGGAHNLPRAAREVTGRSIVSGNRPDQRAVGVGEPHAVPGGHPENGQGRPRQAGDAAVSSEAGAPEGHRTDRAQTQDHPGAIPARTSAHQTDDFEEIPAFLKRA